MKRHILPFTPSEIDALLTVLTPCDDDITAVTEIRAPTADLLWAASGNTTIHDYESLQVEGDFSVAREYLALEQTGAFGELPSREQQRLLSQLASEFDA